MASTIPTSLLDLLRGPALRIRTGLWLVPPADLSTVADEAVRVGIGTVDLRQALLATLPPDANFVALNATRLLELVDAAASQPAFGGCALVLNLDLLLARLTVAQRTDVWDFVYSGFAHRRSALLLVMPSTAQSLLPTITALDKWQHAERIYPPKE